MPEEPNAPETPQPAEPRKPIKEPPQREQPTPADPQEDRPLQDPVPPNRDIPRAGFTKHRPLMQPEGGQAT